MASTSGTRTRAANEDLQVSTQMRDVTSRLVKAFGDGSGEGEDRIRRTVATIEARFGDARVRTFLPILIERAARVELGRGEGTSLSRRRVTTVDDAARRYPPAWSARSATR